jgi:copper homeostasis protein
MALLEVCVDSVESAVAAQTAGAGRVELCDALVLGGVTPSIGKVRAVAAAVARAAAAQGRAPLALHVLVRPRGGDFCYSGAELETMRLDVRALRRERAVRGVVLGALAPDGSVDEPATRALVRAARPRLSVTFHRAVDAARDPLEALRACLRLRVDRVLTSGGARSCASPEGAAALAQMVRVAAAAGDGGGEELSGEEDSDSDGDGGGDAPAAAIAAAMVALGA